MIKIYDDVVTDNEHVEQIAKAIWNCRDYQIGTSDSKNWDTAIFVGTFKHRPDVADLLWNYVPPYCTGAPPPPTSINAHPAGLPGSWHRDDREPMMTALYYPKMGSLWPPANYGREGGLEIKDYGVIPYKDNCLVMFPAHIVHRCLVHERHGKIRFSVAHKLGESSNGDKEDSR